MYNYRNPKPISKQMESAILSKLKYDDTGRIWVETTEDDRFYVSIRVSIRYKSETISIALSRLIFFLLNKRWPDRQKQIDHIDNNSLNNSPSNLQEVTVAENMYKKRGRGNSKYGKTKYGHGITVYFNTRRSKWFADRSLSTRFGFARNKKIYICTDDTLEGLEKKIEKYIKELEILNVFDIFEEDDEN